MENNMSLIFNLMKWSFKLVQKFHRIFHLSIRTRKLKKKKRVCHFYNFRNVYFVQKKPLKNGKTEKRNHILLSLCCLIIYIELSNFRSAKLF